MLEQKSRMLSPPPLPIRWLAIGFLFTATLAYANRFKQTLLCNDHKSKRPCANAQNYRYYLSSLHVAIGRDLVARLITLNSDLLVTSIKETGQSS